MRQTHAAEEPDEIAPDGSEVRKLLASDAASTATFTLAAGSTTTAVRHRSVTEIWFVLGGVGQLWRSLDGVESISALESGVSVDIPLGASFQFRSFGPGPLRLFGTTTPPWPGDDEAYPVPGHWD